MGKKREFLEDWEREVVFYIERYHSIHGIFPDDDKTLNYLLALEFEINREQLLALKNDYLFQESMKVRGLEALSYTAGQFSARQMHVAAVMLNITDRRSDEKKLRDLGVTTEEWSNWMLNDNFAAYVNARAERMIATGTFEAHLGLMRGIRQGNTKAIELFYEMTGRYTKDKDSSVDVRQLIGRILEVIQRHEKDPDKLNRMAIDLSQLAIEATTQTSQTVIKVGPQAEARKVLDF